MSDGLKIVEHSKLIDYLIAKSKDDIEREYLDTGVSYYNEGGPIDRMLHQVSIQNDYDADRGNIGRYGNIQRKQSEFISKTNELTLFATGLEERTTSSRHSGGSNGISGGV